MELQTGNFSSKEGSYYSVDTGARQEYRNRCSRLVVYIFSAIIFIVGIGLMVGGGLQKKNGGVLPICPNCEKIITALFAIGGVILVFGILGVYAAHSRNSCIAAIFIITLLLLAIIFLGAGIGFLVVQGGSHLEQLWQGAVKNEPDAICQLQDRLGCSGFDFCCYNSSDNSSTTTSAPNNFVFVDMELGSGSAGNTSSTTTSTTTTVGTTTATGPTSSTIAPAPSTTTTSTTLAPPVAQCNSLTSASDVKDFCVPTCFKNAAPCGQILKDDLKKLTVPVSAVFFPLGVLSILVAWASKRMLAKEQ
jgi:hypothetical protein